ncbi:hypothetical protein AC249_AIPGENE12832, partial [Exaiptasia diaphana]
MKVKLTPPGVADKDEEISQQQDELAQVKQNFADENTKIAEKENVVRSLQNDLLSEKEQHAQRVQQVTYYEERLQNCEVEIGGLKEERRLAAQQ